MKIDFERLLGDLSPQLKRIARRINGYSRFIDEDDLFQEMCIYLWEKWEQGEIEGKTESYILQGCWFYLKNYLRIINDKDEIISLDEQIDDEGMTLGEIIPDNSQTFDELVDVKLLVEKITTDGLTKREKEVFYLCLEGYTLRKIGERLRISFVRVFKVKKNISKKLKKK